MEALDPKDKSAFSVQEARLRGKHAQMREIHAHTARQTADSLGNGAGIG